jgi:hypothetical protein
MPERPRGSRLEGPPGVGIVIYYLRERKNFYPKNIYGLQTKGKDSLLLQLPL